ncbi:Tropomyosin domain-containing protein [Dioscorea alata]|uniref:Tropomyosin domain-containing protein n=1 Tax=Dioscorea alata TaxID=55571 RepID=A0ACB7UIS5_DIOAL|nr:Tropomyosin domain-containing protein [Dioscorea alata]
MPERSQRRRGLADPVATGVASRPSSSSSENPGNGADVDRVLFKNLVEMVPLVESLMGRRSTSSFTRRASMVYTPAPSHPPKVDTKGRKTAQSVYTKRKADLIGSALKKLANDGDGGADDFTIFSSNQPVTEVLQKEREDVTMLREQLDGLERKILEKDQALKSAEDSLNQMKVANMQLEELKRQITEKDSLIKSSNSQLSNAQIKLAEKQAALEKLELEAKASNGKVEELQADLDCMDFEIRAHMQLFEEISKCDSDADSDGITTFHQVDRLPHMDDPDLDEDTIEKMEEARLAYAAALAAAKEDPGKNP